jgi:uncharacterized protein (DUF1330 family)
MPAFAIAHLRTTDLSEDLFVYMEKLQPTLDPYQGRLRVHGGPVEALEGEWPGSVVVIEFPDLDHARGWYGSPAYQEILPLRTRNLLADAILVDGVGPDYDPARTGARLRRAAAAG